ncbi:MAG: O-antigen ligase family protein [Parcubacteria group bacterium]|nr:O-antigen ligase family protein [Parcubacteria group bacterium]
MHSIQIEKILFWLVRVCAYLLPFTVLIIANSLFFPFITGKNFIFRILVEIMAAGWVGLLIIDFKKYWPQWNFVSISYTVFISAIFVSAVFGVDFVTSFWSNFERMEGLVTHLHLLLLFFILAGTFRTKREWFTLFGVSITASILLAFYGLLEKTGEIVSVADSSRIISTLGNPLYVAAYLSFHIFLSAFLWLQTKSKFLKWMLAGIIIFEISIFFFTEARGAFVGMLAGLGIISVLSFFATKGASKKIVLGSVLVILVLIPVFLNVFKHSPVIANNDTLSRFASISLQAGEARFTIWGIAFDAFKERPILGWGMGNFDVPFAKHYDPNMFGQEPWFDRVHNMPLEWLVTGGAVTFLAYLTFLGSLIVALIVAVRHSILSPQSAFIFVGMFTAYLIQLLFVFDTLGTYLLSVFMFGFLYRVSAASPDEWSEKNSLSMEGMSKVERKNTLTFKLPIIRVAGIVMTFIFFSALIITIDIRPMMGARALIDGFRVFDTDHVSDVKTHFQKALSLARGTVGTAEIREHLTINTLSLDPEQLQKQEVSDLYFFAIEEMEKQIRKETLQNIKIRQNILLAQLYGLFGTYGRNEEARDHSLKQYELVLEFAPRYVYTYPTFANMLAQTGDIGRAIEIIQKGESLLIEADKYDSRIFYSKPLFYVGNRQYDEAYAALLELSVNYGGPDKHLDSAMMENIIRATQGQGGEAIPFLEKVYLLDSSIYFTPLMLAQLYAASENPVKAREYAREVLNNNPALEERIALFLKAIDDKFGKSK